MVGKNDIIEVVVLSVDAENKKISLGMKQITPNPWTLLEERYPPGTRIVGIVRNITDFGVFIGIEEGIDGLVHISDMSWTQKIKHPAELFKKGDEVEAVVLNIDVENERFSLGIKQLAPDPWESIPERFPPGRICSATITKLTDFGAFAEIEDGVEGLIHVSQLSTSRVESPSEVVNVGDTQKVEVISVDPRERKIALSIKSFIHRSEHGRLREYRDSTSSATASLGDVFGDRLTGAHASVSGDELEPADRVPVEDKKAQDEEAQATEQESTEAVTVPEETTEAAPEEAAEAAPEEKAPEEKAPEAETTDDKKETDA